MYGALDSLRLLLFIYAHAFCRIDTTWPSFHVRPSFMVPRLSSGWPLESWYYSDPVLDMLSYQLTCDDVKFERNGHRDTGISNSLAYDQKEKHAGEQQVRHVQADRQRERRLHRSEQLQHEDDAIRRDLQIKQQRLAELSKEKQRLQEQIRQQQLYEHEQQEKSRLKQLRQQEQLERMQREEANRQVQRLEQERRQQLKLEQLRQQEQLERMQREEAKRLQVQRLEQERQQQLKLEKLRQQEQLERIERDERERKEILKEMQEKRRQDARTTHLWNESGKQQMQTPKSSSHKQPKAVDENQRENTDVDARPFELHVVTDEQSDILAAMAVPGFKSRDISLRFTNGRVYIDGYKSDRGDSNTVAHAEFHRQFALPLNVNPKSLRGTVNSKGLLTVTGEKLPDARVEETEDLIEFVDSSYSDDISNQEVNPSLLDDITYHTEFEDDDVIIEAQ